MKVWLGLRRYLSPVAIGIDPLTNFAMVAVTPTGQRSLVVCCSPTRVLRLCEIQIIWLTSSLSFPETALLWKARAYVGCGQRARRTQRRCEELPV